MPNPIAQLKSGRIPEVLRDELGPFSIQAHNDHVTFLQQPGSYDVFGNRFDATAGMYHPHPWSSSVFLVRALLRERPALGRVLEIGCGSGAVGLSLLAHGLANELIMTDISLESVRAAQRNATSLGLQARSTVRQGSLFEPVSGESFDSIIFNLPLMHSEHEGMRHVALDDPRGAVATEFFNRATDFLNCSGSVYITFSNLSEPAILKELSAKGKLSLLAAEWVVETGFWLMVYRLQKPAK